MLQLDNYEHQLQMGERGLFDFHSTERLVRMKIAIHFRLAKANKGKWFYVKCARFAIDGNPAKKVFIAITAVDYM